MKRLLIALGVILAVLVATITESSAQIIYGCYSNTNGALRIVTGSSQCTTSETFIHWNQTGPPGPSGVGNLGVYDGSGLFVGYLVGTHSGDFPNLTSAYQIFNPDIPAFLTIILKNQPALVGYTFGTLWFTSENCSGQAYLFLDWVSELPLQGLFVDAYNPAKYYLYDGEVSPVSGSDIKSNKSTSPGSCGSQTFGPDRVAFPLKQVDVPLMNTTLQYPIVVKAITSPIPPPTYTLSINVNPIAGGSVAVTPLKSSYDVNDSVTLLANPNTGYLFSNWSGDAAGTTPSIQITMTKDMTVTANFTSIGPPPTYTLTVKPYPLKYGSVTLSPSGGSYSAGTQVKITAMPNRSHVFTGWSGDVTGTITGTTNPITITMPSSNVTATANFK